MNTIRFCGNCEVLNEESRLLSADFHRTLLLLVFVALRLSACVCYVESYVMRQLRERDKRRPLQVCGCVVCTYTCVLVRVQGLIREVVSGSGGGGGGGGGVEARCDGFTSILLRVDIKKTIWMH